jgi:hypothetical protein
MSYRRQETGDRRQETGDRRQETGMVGRDSVLSIIIESFRSTGNGLEPLGIHAMPITAALKNPGVFASSSRVPNNDCCNPKR